MKAVWENKNRGRLVLLFSSRFNPAKAKPSHLIDVCGKKIHHALRHISRVSYRRINDEHALCTRDGRPFALFESQERLLGWWTAFNQSLGRKPKLIAGLQSEPLPRRRKSRKQRASTQKGPTSTQKGPTSVENQQKSMRVPWNSDYDMPEF